MQGSKSKIAPLVVAAVIFAIFLFIFAWPLLVLLLVLSSLLFLVASPLAIWEGLVLSIKHFKKSKIPPLVFSSSVLTLIIGVYLAITSPVLRLGQPFTYYYHMVFLVLLFSYLAALITFAVMRHSQGKEGFAKDMAIFSLSLGAVLFWSAFLLYTTVIVN